MRKSVASLTVDPLGELFSQPPREVVLEALRALLATNGGMGRSVMLQHHSWARPLLAYWQQTVEGAGLVLVSDSGASVEPDASRIRALIVELEES